MVRVPIRCDLKADSFALSRSLVFIIIFRILPDFLSLPLDLNLEGANRHVALQLLEDLFRARPGPGFQLGVEHFDHDARAGMTCTKCWLSVAELHLANPNPPTKHEILQGGVILLDQ